VRLTTLHQRKWFRGVRGELVYSDYDQTALSSLARTNDPAVIRQRSGNDRLCQRR
jgi:hypothetical protein